LENGLTKTIPVPIGDLDDEQDERPAVSVQNLCYVPKAWAAHFLAPLTPFKALGVFRSLMASIPAADHEDFNFIEAWLLVACTHTATAPGESTLTAKWQRPHLDRTVLHWIQRHSQHVNQMSAPRMGAAGPPVGGLDPQERFNKALKTVAALKPCQRRKNIRQRNSSAYKWLAP
jgi:hypothetical protein